ncbi:hypothetical protein MNB_SV-5-1385 [hydrothermal vent metagenome]|uniref:Uncharacterized protein n=1 Tax=hydrothermal vent metagenome TaxID=652676 RepID=A0A1W1EBW7_9ZZZZ
MCLKHTLKSQTSPKSLAGFLPLFVVCTDSKYKLTLQP